VFIQAVISPAAAFRKATIGTALVVLALCTVAQAAAAYGVIASRPTYLTKHLEETALNANVGKKNNPELLAAAMNAYLDQRARSGGIGKLLTVPAVYRRVSSHLVHR